MDTAKVHSVMRKPKGQPHFLLGALVGFMLTAALTAIFYVADGLVGTPFVPFDMMDWMARNLPGGLITFGIDTMVKLITTLKLGETSSAAKSAEHFLAVSGLIVTGMVAGAIFFYIMGQREHNYSNSQTPGGILGLIIGIPVALVSGAVNFTATTPLVVNMAWIIAAFVGWGLAMQWVYTDLASIKPKAQADEESPSRVSAQAMDRRSFLVRVGGATATITLVGAGLGAFLHQAEQSASSIRTTAGNASQPTMPSDVPNSGASVQPVPGTRPEVTPVKDHYRIDISSRPPVIDEATYTLPISGLVDNPLSLTLDDIRTGYDSMDQYLTLACISNPIGGDLISTQKWTGVSMQKILAGAGVQDNAKYLRIFGADGFDETVALDLIRQDERIMLTYAWSDEPLPRDHGFPLRIYIPNRYGMKQPKWINEIEVVADYEDGYWVRRGWDRDALMVATSVIDVVATDAAYEANGTTIVPVGGIAHAGDRSISKVEVKVDDGEWQQAQLREPISDKTWVLWRYDWPFSEGQHQFTVRCVDGDGNAQIETPRGTRPSGATGLYSSSGYVQLPGNA